MQTALILDATDDTPKVVLDINKEYFEISKRSLPLSSTQFYLPINDWITAYIKSPKQESKFVFHFEFISTSSTKQIMRLIFLINELVKKHKVTLHWNYDKGDINMRKTGELLEKLVDIKFIYTEV